MYSEHSVFLTNCGRQDCSDMHRWGPGVRQTFIIHYVVKGAGYLEAGGKTYRIEEGESFCTYPGEVIAYYPDEKKPWEYVWVDFVGKEASELLGLTCFRKQEPVCPGIKKEELLPYFDRLRQLDIYYRNKLEANGILRLILGIYGDRCPATKSGGITREDNRLSNAVMLIQANYYKPDFHVADLCDRLNLSRATLYRLFQSCLFMSPNSYPLRFRLEQAKKLLEIGLSAKQTAMSCGFSDQFYFSRIFKIYIGKPPTAYAKEKGGREGRAG